MGKGEVVWAVSMWGGGMVVCLKTARGQWRLFVRVCLRKDLTVHIDINMVWPHTRVWHSTFNH